MRTHNTFFRVSGLSRNLQKEKLALESTFSSTEQYKNVDLVWKGKARIFCGITLNMRTYYGSY